MARTSGGEVPTRPTSSFARRTSGESAVSTSTRRACLAAVARVSTARRVRLRVGRRSSGARSSRRSRTTPRPVRAIEPMGSGSVERAAMASCSTRAATPLTPSAKAPSQRRRAASGRARRAGGERHGVGGERAVGALGRLRRDLDGDALGLVGAAAGEQRLRAELRQREPRGRVDAVEREPLARQPLHALGSLALGQREHRLERQALRALPRRRVGPDGVRVEQVARRCRARRGRRRSRAASPAAARRRRGRASRASSSARSHVSQRLGVAAGGSGACSRRRGGRGTRAWAAAPPRGARRACAKASRARSPSPSLPEQERRSRRAPSASVGGSAARIAEVRARWAQRRPSMLSPWERAISESASSASASSRIAPARLRDARGLLGRLQRLVGAVGVERPPAPADAARSRARSRPPRAPRPRRRRCAPPPGPPPRPRAARSPAPPS